MNASAKRCMFLLTLFITSLSAISQEESWDVYMAQYEKGAGSTVINMSAKDYAPLKEFPFLLETGVHLINCTGDGLPSKAEFDKLYKISDKIKAVIDAAAKNKLVGTFSYQCERIDYYYLGDTGAIRQKIEAVYKSAFPRYKYSITIRKDENWEAYLTFLYPNDETREYMENEKVILNLTKAGDNLSKPRQVDHWLYFKTEDDRSKFVAYCSNEHYKIEGKNFLKDATLHYQLQISRVDNVDLSSISKITILLRKKASELNGSYDGWETIVIKEK